MLTLIQFNLVTLAVALLIGIAAGWWAFGHRRRGRPAAETRLEETPLP